MLKNLPRNYSYACRLPFLCSTTRYGGLRHRLSSVVLLRCCGAGAVFSDSISLGICTNDGCKYTVEVEPDQDRGWCEVTRRIPIPLLLRLAVAV
jgi:hypothetical protein